jgi:hypothetical protein
MRETRSRLPGDTLMTPPRRLLPLVAHRAIVLETQKARLEAEGHAVVSKGKRLIVPDYGSRLARL